MSTPTNANILWIFSGGENLDSNRIADRTEFTGFSTEDTSLAIALRSENAEERADAVTDIGT